jgi:periplasmic protein TonB
MTATHPGPGQPYFGSLLSGGDYQTRPSNFLASFLVHALLVVALWQFATWIVPRDGHPSLAHSPSAVSSIIFAGTGGGGGGTHDLLPASRGVLPRLSPDEQLTPPSAVSLNDNPVLPMPPTLLMAADAMPPQTGQLGDPLSQVAGPASNGPGKGGGIGDGCCGGIGDSHGRGFGEGTDGLYPAGRNGVTTPRVIYDPEPAYSDAARSVKMQGMVTLRLIVGADGRPREIRVQKGLGMGLDEKAIAAVESWRFEPSMLNGRPVAVAIQVEVNFRLY